jgi:signal peptidase II
VTRRGRLAVALYAVAAGMYALDQLTKDWAVHHLAGRAPIKLIPGLLDLRYTTNSGGAFSLLTGKAWLFFVATVGIAGVIVVVSIRLPSGLTAIALGLVLGGAMGNLTDRLTRGAGVSGQVVDFIHLTHWPVFNVADSCVVVGAILVGLASFRHSGRDAEPPAGGEERPAEGLNGESRTEGASA